MRKFRCEETMGFMEAMELAAGNCESLRRARWRPKEHLYIHPSGYFYFIDTTGRANEWHPRQTDFIATDWIVSSPQ